MAYEPGSSGWKGRLPVTRLLAAGRRLSLPVGLLLAVSIAQTSQGADGPRLMKVFGPDDREAVVDTTHYPWSAVGQVLAYYDLRVLSGTGVMIGDRVVLTCAHIVRDSVLGTPRSVVFIPGKNGPSEPFGRFAAASISIRQEWLTGRDDRYDIALLDLGAAVGSLTGHFDAASRPLSFFDGRVLRMAGYPSDLSPDGRLYKAVGEARRVDDGLVVHRIDGGHGQSGGPIWFDGPSGRSVVVAVYTGEVDEYIGGQLVDAYNVGVYISPVLCRWINDFLVQTDSSAGTVCADESGGPVSPWSFCGLGAVQAAACGAVARAMAAGVSRAGRRRRSGPAGAAGRLTR